MKKFLSRKSLGVAALLTAAALAMTGCGGDTGGGGTEGAGGGDAAGLSFDVAKDVAITGSPTFDKIKSSGKIRIGVKEDQPGLGFLDAATGERSGFDIEIARWMAASLGVDPSVTADKIEFKAIPSANRESALANGDVDLYVGTYSITDKRKKLVDFAGPYFITGQGLLVAKDNTDITSEKDLDGKKVCSATGSTPLQNIVDNFPEADPIGFDIYTKCVEALTSGSVDAVTTDQAILLGYASQDPDNLKVVGEPFTVEKYGVGLPLGDTALQTFLNTTLTDGNATWTKIFDATLGKSGTKVEQPAVEK